MTAGRSIPHRLGMPSAVDVTASWLGARTRRDLLRQAAGAAAASLAASRPAVARTLRSRPPTVAVFGGGIAGLTAAHELAERGFQVTLYERRAWGGKARSADVAGSGRGGRRALPSEHGWRVFFGFYENTVDTFRRIADGSNARGVFDNLVPAPLISFAREGPRDLVLPIGQVDPRAYTPEQVIDLILGAGLERGMPPEDWTRFVGRLAVFFSSCDARRLGQWERTTWTDFARAHCYTEHFRRMIITGASEWVQASKAERTSALFPGRVLEALIYSLLGLGANGATVRVLNRPTNEALIDPWLDALQRLGVRLREHRELRGFAVRRGRIASARIKSARGSFTVTADHYVCALPVERARRLWTRAIRDLDPQLARMQALSIGWMNGLKLFLREPTPIVRGHVYCVDSPWLISAVSQAQFWPLDFAGTYGDGTARESLSVIISNWDTPGVLFGKAARDCTPEEIIREVWEQLKRHLNDGGDPILTDDLLHSWEIDPGMARRGGRLMSDDPLVLPAVGERECRPDAATAIPNLFLAGDYLKSSWEVANMEAASYNARRAVNAVLARSGSKEPPAATIEPYRPPEWEPLKRVDEERYGRGEPNLLDADLPPAQLAQRLRTAVP